MNEKTKPQATTKDGTKCWLEDLVYIVDLNYCCCLDNYFRLQVYILQCAVVNILEQLA